MAAGPLEGGAVSMAAAFDGHAGAGVAAAAASLLPVWLAQAILRDGNTTGGIGCGGYVKCLCIVPCQILLRLRVGASPGFAWLCCCRHRHGLPQQPALLLQHDRNGGVYPDAAPCPPLSPTPPGFTAECVRLDNHLRLNRAEKSGSTAAVALVTGTTLVTANMGDSTILLVKGDGSVVVLSAQHNTLDEGELARLQAEGAQLRAVPKQGAPGGVMHRIYDAAGVQGLMCSRWVTGGDNGCALVCMWLKGGGTGPWQLLTAAALLTSEVAVLLSLHAHL